MRSSRPITKATPEVSAATIAFTDDQTAGPASREIAGIAVASKARISPNTKENRSRPSSMCFSIISSDCSAEGRRGDYHGPKNRDARALEISAYTPISSPNAKTRIDGEQFRDIGAYTPF